MNIGELFIELGISGADGVAGKLDTVAKGVSKIATETLAAIGLVTGFVYAFGKLAEISGQTGVNLQNFSIMTGQSSEMLQRWQYILQQSNVDKDDTLKTFNNLYATLAKIDLLHPPADWLQFILSTEKVDFTKIGSMPLDQQMEVFRKFAQDGRVALRDRVQMLRESGLFSDQMIRGLVDNKLNPNKDVPTWFLKSQNEVKQLDHIAAAWKNFYAQLGRLRDRFVEKYSGRLLGSLEKDLFPKLQELSVLLGHLADALGDNGIKALGVTLLAIFNPLAALVAATLWGLLEIKKITTASPDDLKKFAQPQKPEVESDFAKNARKLLHNILGAPPTLAPSTVNVTQHIHGSNADEIAHKSAKQINKHVKAPYYSNPKKNEFGG